MVVAILAFWIAFLWILVAVGVFKKWTLWMKLSPLVLYLILIIGLIIPMTYSAPLGKVAVLAYSVQVAPEVSGMVSEVPIKAGVPLKKGDVLFKLDPSPFKARVNQVKAQLALAKLKLDQKSQLAATGTGRRVELEEAQANADQLTAQLAGETWDLEQTIIRAPADGYVPNQALQAGARVNAGVPVMPFIETTEQVIAMKVAQSHFQHIRTDQPAEVLFELFPGKIFDARVKFIVQANPEGQVTPSGLALSATSVSREPFVVELKLDQPIKDLPPGSIGEATIYTDTLKITHAVRRVMMRMNTWLNYLPI